MAICLLAILTGGRYGLYCLAWCLIVVLILFSLRQNLIAMESLERSRKRQGSKAVIKFQEIKSASKQNQQKSNHRIEEIPPGKSKTKSQKTS
jgi:hypothetical protein